MASAWDNFQIATSALSMFHLLPVTLAAMPALSFKPSNDGRETSHIIASGLVVELLKLSRAGGLKRRRIAAIQLSGRVPRLDNVDFRAHKLAPPDIQLLRGDCSAKARRRLYRLE